MNEILDNISFSEYLKIPAVSNSYLGRLDKCPAAAKIEQPDTPSMAFGRAVHALALEGIEAFQARFQRGPDCGKKNKEDRATWADAIIRAENTGRQLLDNEDYDRVFACAAAVKAHPVAAKLLSGGVREQTLLWADYETGLPCKARPDIVPDEKTSTLIDLKTTSDASAKGFLRSILKYGYARQAAFYLDGLNWTCGGAVKVSGRGKYDHFIFIAVETTPPHMAACYLLDDLFLGYGRSEYKRLLTLETECRAKAAYPAYQNDELEVLSLPAWL